MKPVYTAQSSRLPHTAVQAATSPFRTKKMHQTCVTWRV